MATKQLNTNQHEPLHKLYPDNCCLCQSEKTITMLKKTIQYLENRLKSRDEQIKLLKKELKQVKNNGYN